MPGAASTSHAFFPNMGWEAIRSRAVHFINKRNQLRTAIPRRSSSPQRLVSHLHRPAKLGTAPEGSQHPRSLTGHFSSAGLACWLFSQEGLGLSYSLNSMPVCLGFQEWKSLAVRCTACLWKTCPTRNGRDRVIPLGFYSNEERMGNKPRKRSPKEDVTMEAPTSLPPPGELSDMWIQA